MAKKSSICPDCGEGLPYIIRGPPNHRYCIGESSVYHCQKSKQLLFSLSMKPGKWQNPSRCRCPSSDDVGLRTNGDITACAVTRSDSVATSCANPELDQRCGPSKMSSRSPEYADTKVFSSHRRIYLTHKVWCCHWMYRLHRHYCH